MAVLLLLLTELVYGPGDEVDKGFAVDGVERECVWCWRGLGWFDFALGVSG